VTCFLYEVNRIFWSLPWIDHQITPL